MKTAELYNPDTGLWSNTEDMNEARAEFILIRMADGKALAIGGMGINGELKSCEVYDPTTGAWSTTGSLAIFRAFAGAALLADGKVLVAGGSYDSGNNNWVYLSSAELYDPGTGLWSGTGSLKYARNGPAATLLLNGKVLVAGGFGGPPTWQFLSSCELYDPGTGLFSDTGSFRDGRSADRATTLLPNGKVLMAGGWGNTGTLSSCQLYDPDTGTWSDTGSLKQPRQEQPAVLLLNGNVLTFGGYGPGEIVLGSSELYNPATGRWKKTGFLKTARVGSTAVLLPNGKVLAAGGHGEGGQHLSSAELYNPGEALPCINLLLFE
jgi:N-acetylneuraminic acid mutarotase